MGPSPTGCLPDNLPFPIVMRPRMASAAEKDFTEKRLDSKLVYDGEFLEVVPMKIAEVLEWVRLGKITEAKAVTGILWAEKFLRGEWR